MHPSSILHPFVHLLSTHSLSTFLTWTLSAEVVTRICFLCGWVAVTGPKGPWVQGQNTLVLTWAIKLTWLWTSPILSCSLGVGVEEKEGTLSNSF